MMDWKTKADELQNAAERIIYLEEIYNKVQSEMQWNAMQFHSADEEHEESWFTEPEEDDYNYRRYLTYKEVLAAIEKLVK